jgi:hypothetical protein
MRDVYALIRLANSFFAIECLPIYIPVAGHAHYMLIRAMSLLELRRQYIYQDLYFMAFHHILLLASGWRSSELACLGPVQ